MLGIGGVKFQTLVFLWVCNIHEALSDPLSCILSVPLWGLTSPISRLYMLVLNITWK